MIRRVIEAVITSCTRKVACFVEPLDPGKFSWKVRNAFCFSFPYSFFPEPGGICWKRFSGSFLSVCKLSFRHLPVDINGELSEWSKELVSKTSVPSGYRGFEPLTLRWETQSVWILCSKKLSGCNWQLIFYVSFWFLSTASSKSACTEPFCDVSSFPKRPLLNLSADCSMAFSKSRCTYRFAVRFSTTGDRVEYIFSCDADFYIRMFGRQYPTITRHIELTGFHNTKF